MQNSNQCSATIIRHGDRGSKIHRCYRIFIKETHQCYRRILWDFCRGYPSMQQMRRAGWIVILYFFTEHVPQVVVINFGWDPLCQGWNSAGCESGTCSKCNLCSCSIKSCSHNEEFCFNTSWVYFYSCGSYFSHLHLQLHCMVIASLANIARMQHSEGAKARAKNCTTRLL